MVPRGHAPRNRTRGRTMTTPAAPVTRSVFRAEGFSCPSCVSAIEQQVGRLPGVRAVTVKFASGRVDVDHLDVMTAEGIVRANGRAGSRAAPALHWATAART